MIREFGGNYFFDLFNIHCYSMRLMNLGKKSHINYLKKEKLSITSPKFVKKIKIKQWSNCNL